jgi:hypothetical protein
VQLLCHRTAECDPVERSDAHLCLFYFYPWQFTTFHNFHHLIAAVSGTHLQTSAAAQMHASSASQKHLRYYLLQMTSRLLFVTI